jgi:hypothetical protein
MEAATEAAMVDTTAAATAAMTPQANAAEATTGEVAAAGGSAATPAEAATASTSHFPHQLNIRVHHHSFIFFLSVIRNMVAISVQGKKSHVVYNIRT